MSAPNSGPGRIGPPADAGRSLLWYTLDALVTGVVILVPLVITVYVLGVVLDFVTSALQPLVRLLEWSGVVRAVQRAGLSQFLVEADLYWDVVGVLGELIALVVLLLVVFLVGTAGRNRYGERFVAHFDARAASIPGIGMVYRSFRQMGEVMLDGGADRFREVKLVEWSDGVFVLGFVTDPSPRRVGAATELEDVVAVFVPFAPNPVTGGLLTYVSAEKLRDVDMSLEEGLGTILTSGLAGEGRSQSAR